MAHPLLKYLFPSKQEPGVPDKQWLKAIERLDIEYGNKCDFDSTLSKAYTSVHNWFIRRNNLGNKADKPSIERTFALGLVKDYFLFNIDNKK